MWDGEGIQFLIFFSLVLILFLLASIQIELDEAEKKKLTFFFGWRRDRWNTCCLWVQCQGHNGCLNCHDGPIYRRHINYCRLLQFYRQKFQEVGVKGVLDASTYGLTCNEPLHRPTRWWLLIYLLLFLSIFWEELREYSDNVERQRW